MLACCSYWLRKSNVGGVHVQIFTFLWADNDWPIERSQSSAKRYNNVVSKSHNNPY